MKKLILIIFSFISLTAFGQQDSGFTDKKEAKNLTVNGLKEGKWCTYFSGYGMFDDSITKDSSAPYYDLCIYNADRPVGVDRLYNKNGSIKRITPYINGKQNGFDRIYYDNGKLELEIPYVNGKKDGKEKAYYENGQLEAEYHFKNGIANGHNKGYYENGRLKWEASLINDGGLEKDYYENGKLKSEITTYDGHFVSRKDYDEAGNEIKQ